MSPGIVLTRHPGKSSPRVCLIGQRRILIVLGIDTSFDLRTDARGRDPDSSSPTLRAYHKLLWSKPLPSGELFDLDDTTPRSYLHHRSELGEFFLSSDSIIQTFIQWKRAKHIIESFPPAENEEFMSIGYTIGGMTIFPANRVAGKNTINGARGLNARIRDRMDLTLECIRLHYLGIPSPLSDTLARYDDFFVLFSNFQGYAEFFLLHDLVDETFSTVRFFMPFDDFETPAVPGDPDAYREYRRRSTEFVQARNRRIDAK